MRAYILDDFYAKEEEIDTYSTFIWTEQYNDLGIFEMKLPMTDEMYGKLAPGTKIGNSESEEIGVIHTREVHEGVIHLTGHFLLSLFLYRVFRATLKHQDQYGEFVGTPGQLINYMVDSACVNPATFPYVPNASYNKITNLAIGTIDLTGTSRTFGVTYGKLWDTIKTIAQEAEMGVKMTAWNTGPGLFSMQFNAWYGDDRTSGQAVLPAVIFDPALDSLANSNELDSKLQYYNVCHAYAPGIDPADFGGADEIVGTAVGAGYTTSLRDWDRRVMMLAVGDVTTDQVGGNASTLQSVLVQRAKDALANNNYVRLADGELVPQVGFQYGTDYFIGDLITLRGPVGARQTARVTEYIRSQDGAGYREYPTLSIVD